jgi:hypothetical protein
VGRIGDWDRQDSRDGPKQATPNAAPTGRIEAPGATRSETCVNGLPSPIRRRPVLRRRLIHRSAFHRGVNAKGRAKEPGPNRAQPLLSVWVITLPPAPEMAVLARHRRA